MVLTFPQGLDMRRLYRGRAVRTLHQTLSLTAPTHGGTDDMTEFPDLPPGWDWLQLTIPINKADINADQIAQEAADAARAALERPA